MRAIIEDAVERLFGDLVGAPAIVAAESAWPADLWRLIEDTGLMSATGSASEGGRVPWSDVYVIVRAAGWHAVPLPVSETLFAHWLLGAANLPPPSGPLTFATEPLHLSESGHVSGILRSVPWGRNVGQVIAMAQQIGGHRTLVQLNPKEAGIELGSNIACEPRDRLTFDQVAPIAIAELPAFWSADVMRMGGALLRSAQMGGALKRILKDCVEYAQVRRQFGRAIGSFQTIQHEIAVLAEQSAAVNCIAETSFASLNSSLPLLQIASAKVVASDAAGAGAALAHGIYGAIGMASEHTLNLFTRRLWAWRSEYGSRDYWARYVGKLACEAGDAQFWSMITDVDLECESLAGDTRE